MPFSVHVSEDGQTVTLKVKGELASKKYLEFREAYETAPGRAAMPNYVVDLLEAEGLNSSALGMFLLLREYAGCDRRRVSIINCDKVTKEVLDIANFDKLFTVTGRE